MKWIIVALIALTTLLATAPQVFGDGSDPMPLCRGVDKNGKPICMGQ